MHSVLPASLELALRLRYLRVEHGGPLTLVYTQLPIEGASPLADLGNANYTELSGFGDLDTMGKLHGHVRAENPGMYVFFTSPRS